jgi:hypothetical protein
LKKRIVAIYPAKKTQSPIRWGILGNDKVFYLIPDKNNPIETIIIHTLINMIKIWNLSLYLLWKEL